MNTFLSRFNYRFMLMVGLLASVTIACKDDKDDNPEPGPTGYTVPTTYNFENVDYSGQTDRLAMLAEMTAYMKTANTSGTTVSAQQLKEMYANTGDHFTGTGLNTSGKQLKSKTFELDRAGFEAMMDKLEAASMSTTPGSNGTAGVVTSSDGAKKYLVDENGIEYTQLIEKGLMGAVFYYQATAVYLGEDRIGPTVDNTTVTPGKGTDMEHHWDEAFGYFGAPTDFPTNTNDVSYWANYSNRRDGLISSNQVLMDAFLKGRAAISNNDMTAKDEAVTVIRENWERICAANVIHYLNSGKANIADDALRNHALSEGIAFAGALKYNPNKKITQAQIDQVLSLIGANLYEVTPANLDQARDLVSGIYGMDSIKDQL